MVLWAREKPWLGVVSLWLTGWVGDWSPGGVWIGNVLYGLRFDLRIFAWHRPSIS